MRSRLDDARVALEMLMAVTIAYLLIFLYVLVVGYAGTVFDLQWMFTNPWLAIKALWLMLG